ncbi:type VI secretion system protein TssA [Halospina denitrificans]|nr:type VI secretion system protein TssA [Halospina denitrificans]
MDDQATLIFDPNTLLEAISESQPCGDDTREDSSHASPYFNLKDLRNQARASERQQLIENEALQVPQWRQLLDEIPDVLVKRSKDLEFVAWYVEALCREHGFEGLAQGFDLARRMLETHWNNLYPLPDEEGAATRIAPLVGLNGSDSEGTLIQPILSIPLFHNATLGDVAVWQVEQAAEISRLDEQKTQQRIEAGALAEDDVMQAVRETPESALLAIHGTIERAQKAFTGLSEAMDRVMDGEPQPTSHIRSVLERCKSILMHYAGARIEKALARESQMPEAAGQDPEMEGEGAEPTGGPHADPVQVAIASRARALEQLSQLAEFFRQTEPHSPVSYAINQAVRWSELSLPELMQELIDDKGVREGFARITGVPDPESQKQ